LIPGCNKWTLVCQWCVKQPPHPIPPSGKCTQTCKRVYRC
jgi:hypothetical protein